MNYEELKKYKTKITIIIFLLTTLIILIGISINTIPFFHDLFFKTYIYIFTRYGLEKISLFEAFPFVAIVMLFVIGNFYFFQQRKYRLANGLKEEIEPTPNKKIFYVLSSAAFIFLVFLIVEGVSHGMDSQIPGWLVVAALMMFIFFLFLSLI